MPVFEHYNKQLESHIADLNNIGGREAGSCTGVLVLAFNVSVVSARVCVCWCVCKDAVDPFQGEIYLATT